MADGAEVVFNAPHAPHANAIEAFGVVLSKIKHEIVKSRRDWDKHEPKMWSRAAGLSDEQLVDFSLEKDLVEVRSGPTSYGTIILGKIRIPAVNDDLGEGFIHVRYVTHHIWRWKCLNHALSVYTILRTGYVIYSCSLLPPRLYLS